MRAPSARMFPSVVSIFNQTGWSVSVSTPQPNTDEEGGYSPSYSDSPSQSNVACSIQYLQDAEEVDNLGRITQARLYHFFFQNEPGVSPRDKLVWVDNSGVTRTAYVQASKDMGFFGVVYRVGAIERT